MAIRSKSPINNKILEWFIDDFNITLAEVAKKVGTTPAKVQTWIDGSDSPTYTQAEKLAYDVFKKPLAVFFMSELPGSLSVKKKFRSLPDYLFEVTSYKTRLAINKADFFRTVLSELYITNPSKEPIFRTLRIQSDDDVIKTAGTIREALGIDHSIQKSFRDVYKGLNYYRSAFEELGIFTFQLHLEGERAFCLLDDEFPVIILNSGDSPNSKIFSMFHELAHILMGNEDIYSEVNNPVYLNDPNEILCNKIAAEVLVPINEFTGQYASGIKVIEETVVQKIANNYCVSKEVILRRLLELGKTSSGIYLDYKKKWDDAFMHSESSGGDYYRNKISALGKTYVNKVFDEFRNGRISDGQITNFLGIKYAQLARIESEVYV
jgi:Zn-dependent peptidase ImmA (M78 family)